MKKLTRCFALLVICLICFKASGQMTGRLKVGLNLATMIDKDQDETYSDDYKMNIAFHAGFGIDIPFTNVLSNNSGMLMETMG